MFKSIGERYRKARKKLGFSLRQAERASGIKNTSINKVELDKTESPNHKYTTFLIEQGINPYFLVGLSDEIEGQKLEDFVSQSDYQKLEEELKLVQNKYDTLNELMQSLQIEVDEDGNVKKKNN